MVRECIQRRESAYGLHRLGVTMHAYLDVWAHQGFAGVNHRVNEAKRLLDENDQPDRNLMDRLKNYFISEALPLGHGAVLSHPDRRFYVGVISTVEVRKLAVIILKIFWMLLIISVRLCSVI